MTSPGDPLLVAESTPADDLTAVARLASLVESSEDAILSRDLNGTVRTWNGSAEALYGYSAADAIGRNIAELLAAVPGGDEAQITEKILAGERVQRPETFFRRQDGSVVCVSLTVSPIRDRSGKVVGAAHVAREIGERRRLEEANARLAAIVESSEDAIVSKNLDGVIRTWNAGAERVYGYSSEEAVGRNISFLLPPDKPDEEAEILAKLRRGERVEHFETVRLHKSGRLIEVSLSISPIRNPAGKVVGASHIARDITERKNFEQQMRQAQRLESLGVLAGGVAHDFNNLLTGIMGNASLLADDLPPSHAAQERLRDLLKAAERAADLTSQLLAYSGKGQFVIGPVNVSEAAAEIANLAKATISKAVVVRLDLEPYPPDIEADRSQIQQLVMNLIINGAEAISESRTGTVLVRTGTEHLDQEAARAYASEQLAPGDYVFIEVQDNGCGMNEETRARIFDPFFTTKFTGRGLGLAAALGIVNAHRGAIRVRTAPGEGSTFRVLLPVMKAVAQRPGATEQAAARTILVVDDEEIVRKVARLALEKHGYRVLLAANGAEALEIFRKLSSSVSLVVLDLAMPVLSGEQALPELRAIRDVPVILSSGYNETEAMRRFEHSRLAGFIQKPYTSMRLRAAVDAALRTDHARRRNGARDLAN